MWLVAGPGEAARWRFFSFLNLIGNTGYLDQSEAGKVYMIDHKPFDVYYSMPVIRQNRDKGLGLWLGLGLGLELELGLGLGFGLGCTYLTIIFVYICTEVVTTKTFSKNNH